MKKFKDFIGESKDPHKVVSGKLKDTDSLKKFSYPTPEERRAQMAKENKVKESVEELDEKENQEHQFIMQSLADKDINSSVKDGKVVVHKDNASKAKTHLKRIGHGDMQVVHESEEIDEMTGHTTKTLSKELKKLGWDLHNTTGGHDVYKHPKSTKNLAVPRHAGELSRPTITKILKQAELREMEAISSFKEFIAEAKITITHLESGKYGTDHGGVQHFSNVNGKEHTWNYVKRSDDKWIATDKESSQGVHIHGTKTIIKHGIKESEDLMEDLHSKLSSHIRSMRDSGHNVVVTHRGENGNSAKFISTDKSGTRKLHTVTINSIKQERLDGKGKVDAGEESESKRGRGRPAGSKSGSRV